MKRERDWERERAEEEGERDSVEERREKSRWREESLCRSPLASDHGGREGWPSSLLREMKGQ